MTMAAKVISMQSLAGSPRRMPHPHAACAASCIGMASPVVRRCLIA